MNLRIIMSPASSRTRFCASLALGLAFSPCVSLLAQAAPTSEQIRRYDQNGDGKLDEAELKRLRAEESAAPQGEPYQLSPFEVKADSSGYFASNTMSGTKLNTKLEDLGASITVVTKQQLLDTAAVDINDVFLYEANTEGTKQYTEQSVDFQGRVVDSVAAEPYTSNRIRGLSSSNISINGFSTNSRIPFDAYNIESIEISRGSNSILAGLGNSGGTTNINQATANLTREISKVTLRGDDWGGYRSELDLNRPVLRNKLGLRVLGLYDSKGMRRKPSEDTQKRVTLAATYKPFSGTTLKASLEHFRQFRRTPNAQTPTDMVSDWLNNGRPTWDPVTFTARVGGQTFQRVQSNENNAPDAATPGLPYGLGRDPFFDNMPSLFIEPNGTVGLYTVNRLQPAGAIGTANWTGDPRLMTSYSSIARFRNTGSGSMSPLANLIGVSSRDIYDYENINLIAPNYRQEKARNLTLQAEQKLFDTGVQQAYAQVAWRVEESETYNHTILDDTTNIFIDVNERLLDGSANPYFLRPYVNGVQKTFRNQPIVNDTARAMLSYQFDLTKGQNKWLGWLGRHQLAGFYEHNTRNEDNFAYRELVTSDEAWITLSNRYGSSHAATTDRFYIGDAVVAGSNRIVDYAPATWELASGTYSFRYAPTTTTANLTGTNPTPASFVNKDVTLSGNAFGGVTRTRTNLDTVGGAFQSWFWKGRVVTTLGFREDQQKYRYNAYYNTSGTLVTNSAYIDPATGYGGMQYYDTWGPWTEKSGQTATYQGVLKPFLERKFVEAMRSRGGARGYMGELIEGLQFHYNYADAFKIADPALNLWGDDLGVPHGRTRDYGFSVRFTDKLNARFNWYDANEVGARADTLRVVVLITKQIEVAGEGSAGASWTAPDTNSFEGFARSVINERMPTASIADKETALYNLVGLPNGYYDKVRNQTLLDVNNTSAKGVEVELTYNPSRNFRLKFSAAQNKARDEAQIAATRSFIQNRLPYWTSASRVSLTTGTNAGKAYTSTTGGLPSAVVNFQRGILYNAQVANNIKMADANEGKQRLQTSEWTANVLANYSFATGRLKGFGVGGAIRWADKRSLGFYGLPNPNTGVLDEFDPTRPIFQPAVASYDFTLSYRFRLFHDKVGGSVQLNGKDVFAKRGLTAIKYNPDGTPATFRIKDGAQWTLTTSFDL